ncbi:helix-turn-helix domain-containing protein [Chitiniphilus purpureus]|uniref:Helix-turn-helix domain-containing protein n=1 Tax=Chitiniphilus purpureus TaxID=2981137 RepID=A0ABY6DIS5_9NEIS|nr:helix-turn-helix domain-containing protein [Chitiniphilus sp. CD1]UXY14255.1 helix-turn-helix domain-containing protein [Chitiniphilus sp. CD1]
MTDQQTESTISQGVGPRLKARREQMGLAIDQVANQLKLARKQIEAIEADHYETLPGNTFARGFVRNYAKLLELEAAPLLADLEGLLPTERIQSALPSVREEEGFSLEHAGRGNTAWPALLVGIVAFLAVFGGVWWYLQQPASPQLDVPNATLELPEAPQTHAASMAVEPAASAPAASAPQLTVASTPAAQAASQAELRLSALAESWVQITDADGKRVLSEVLPAGAERNVAGRAPYRVKIGNAPQTRLYLRGKPVDLAPYTKVNVAAFELK